MHRNHCMFELIMNEFVDDSCAFPLFFLLKFRSIKIFDYDVFVYILYNMYLQIHIYLYKKIPNTTHQSYPWYFIIEQ